MSYFTGIFNPPELKNDVLNNLPLAYQNKNSCVVIGERKFHLNRSKSKFVSIGLAHDYKYEPCIKLSGNKCDVIIFNKEEWTCFLNYQGVLSNYLHCNETMDSIDAGIFQVTFEEISNVRVIKVSKNNSYIYLGYETVCKLWECLPLINYRLNILEGLQFPNYYKIVQKGLQSQEGNVFDNALDLLQPEKNRSSESVSMIMELIYIYPEVFEIECKRL